MKSLVLLILTISVLGGTVIPNTNLCTCVQIKSQADCTQSSSCVWSNNACIPKLTSSVTYCSTLTNCNTTTGCALVSGNCTFFTGCTAYLQTSDS